jgi:hypothetical protein
LRVPFVANPPNPIFGNEYFVRQHYADFLARQPDAAGFNAWVNLLRNCADVNNFDPASPSAACDRITVSAAFFGSNEFQLKGFYVYRFYKLGLRRQPAYAEIVRDMGVVSGQTPAETFAKKSAFADAFATRVEFTNIHANMTNAEFVAALLARYNLSGIVTHDPQQPDGTALVALSAAQLIARLDAGSLTRAQVLRAVADSNEVYQAEYNRAFVAMQYYGYLRRTPEDTGYNNWLNYLNAHPGDYRTMVNGFMNSVEYRLRFARP